MTDLVLENVMQDDDDHIPIERTRPKMTDEEERRLLEGSAKRREEAFKKWIADPKIKEYLDRLRRRAALGE